MVLHTGTEAVLCSAEMPRVCAVEDGEGQMTRKDKLLEARAAISDGMERTAVQRDIWQNELIWWLCKAVLLLIEEVQDLKDLKTQVRQIRDRL